MGKRVPIGVQRAAVDDFLNGRKTLDAIATEQGVTLKTVREWIRTWKRGVEMRELGREPARQAEPSPAATPAPAPAPKKPEKPEEPKKFSIF